MTQEDREMLNRINDYANEVLDDIDPQKTPVSYQLEKLRPIMQQVAMERRMCVENICVKSMARARVARGQREAKFQDDFSDVAPSFSQIANNLE